MTRKRTRTLGRIKRGDKYAPGRYWLAFMICSFVVHAFTLAVMSNAALSFIQTLRRPVPPPETLLYVNLLYPGPAPLPSGEVRLAAAAVAKVSRPQTRGQAVPEWHTSKRPDMHAEEVSVKPPTIPPAQPLDDAPHVKVAGVTARNEKEPRTIREPETRDTVIRETEVLKSVDNETIQLITGTKKTTISLADLHKADAPDVHKTEPPRETLNRYSSVRAASTYQTHPASPADAAVRQGNPVVTPAPAQLEDPAQAMQPSPPHLETEETLPPLAAVPKTPDNPGQAAVPGPDAMRPSDNEPLPSSSTATLKLNTTITPPPGATLKLNTSISPAPAAVTAPLSPGAEKATALSAAVQAPPPAAAPKPSPPKVITVKDVPENAGKPLRIKITAPKGGVTDKSLIDITGMVEGRGVNSVTLSIRGEERELLVRDGAFRASAQLEEGRNEIVAKALDEEGGISKDSVSVTYVPAFTATSISFTSPVNNGTLDAMKQKGLMISGAVKGNNIGTVRAYLNKTVLDIAVKDGRFSRTVPIEAEDNMLYAEATDGRTTYRSEKIQFRVLNLYPKDLAVRVEFPGKGDAPRLRYRWAPHPLSEKTGRIPPAPEFLADVGPEGDVVSVGEAVPGIYTVGLEYEMKPGEVREATFKVTLYGYDPGRKKTRTIGPIKLMGKGYLPAVRVLLPEKVFWEDDGWFSGRVESGQGTMKYKEPEGIEWKEEE